jgi:hypothetical protein
MSDKDEIEGNYRLLHEIERLREELADVRAEYNELQLEVYDKQRLRIDALGNEREALRTALQAMVDGEPRAVDLAIRALAWGKL